ncbi:MAG: DUF4136 domain-containing protein [Pedobacter sp.]|nr:DUF4136 domain-containing protein [Pedobacter sp.]
MFRKLIVALAVMTATTAAQALDFKVLADRNADFKGIATYKIDDVKIIRSSGAKVKQANVDALRAAVEQKLQEEGLSKSDKPDVRVSVVAGTEPGAQVANTQIEPYFDGAWRVLPKQGTSEEAPEQEPVYSQATLRIDIKNAKTGDVIWRAIANDTVKLPVTRKFVDAQLHQVFEQFPPPAAQ